MGRLKSTDKLSIHSLLVYPFGNELLNFYFIPFSDRNQQKNQSVMFFLHLFDTELLNFHFHLISGDVRRVWCRNRKRRVKIGRHNEKNGD